MDEPTGAPPEPPVAVIPDDYPQVEVFLRGYLHQDFLQDFTTARQARDAFAGEASAGDRDLFARECEALGALLARLPFDAARQLLVDGFGTAWWPTDEKELESVFPPPAGPVEP
jgi:hypothetical protein